MRTSVVIMSKAQLDMFSTQASTYPSEPASYAPDPDRIRRKLDRVLAQLGQSEELPWDTRTLRFQQLVFPQMTSALPEEEAAQYRMRFDAELDRLSVN